jgi:hypothetical protein
MRLSYALLLLGIAAAPVMAADFSTPQGALRALEQAQRSHNIEAAVAAKNFQYEAYAMLANLKSMPRPEAAHVQEAAHVLELAYRDEIKKDGFPNMEGVRTQVVSTKHLSPTLVEMDEQVAYPDGYISHEIIYAVLSNKRWGIVNLPNK